MISAWLASSEGLGPDSTSSLVPDTQSAWPKGHNSLISQNPLNGHTPETSLS